MKTRWTLAVLAAWAATTGAGVAPETRAEPLVWREWSDRVFQEAKREERFVLLDLEAVWCHWCHVMAETTYRDPEVVGLLRARYIPVRVDQDARPDLSNRYEDYGWPATVIFDAEGRELVKFSGYIAPPRMASLLQGVLDDPTPGPSVRAEAAPVAAEAAALSPPLKKRLEELLVSRYDSEHGGWGFVHKYLDPDCVEYSMTRAAGGDEGARRRTRETLDAQLRLLDPVWGGVYQYSDGGTWDNPHFEKIMSMQAEDLRIYALAYARWHDPRYLKAAQDIRRFLQGFLASPEGAFYSSQDADLVPGEHSAEYFALGDAQRRAKGIPRVDRHVYARENAWAAAGLLALHAATGDDAALAEARRALEFIVEHRGLPGGGFRHDESDAAGPYLGDTAAAGRAFLLLYAATGERAWLARAEEAARFLDGNFRGGGTAGFVTAKPRSSLEAGRPQRDENILVARLANLLFHYTGASVYRQMAERAMRYLGADEVATRFETGGVLLADAELSGPPLHITVVGRRDDPGTRALLRAALAEATSYRRIELWDRREGPLPHSDVEFPDAPQAAAYICTEGRCSAPARTALALEEKLARLHAPRRGEPAGQ